MIFDGRKSIYCRMYDGLKDVIRGFSKFIFAAMNYRVLNLVSVIIFILLLFLLPVILLPMGLYLFDWPYMVNLNLLIQVSIILFIRVVMTFRFNQRIFDIIWHPFSMLYIAILAFNSVYQAKYGKGIYWKDRYYNIDDSEEAETGDMEV